MSDKIVVREGFRHIDGTCRTVRDAEVEGLFPFRSTRPGPDGGTSPKRTLAPLMKPRSKAHFTIGQIMARVAAVAVVLGAMRLSRPEASTAVHILCLAAGLFLGTYALLRIWGGILCPRCSQMTLRRLPAASGGFRFFRCGACGIRLKRYRLGPWLDASGSLDDFQFRRKSVAGTFQGALSPDVDGTTCGMLLGKKRQRDLWAMMKAVTKTPWRKRVSRGEGPPLAGDEETTCGRLLRSKKSRNPSSDWDSETPTG